MENTIKTEVAIVGAGPTGLSLACQFIRYGVPFVIIDKKETVTPYSKALGVHARTLEVYEQLALADKAVAEGIIAGKARILEGGEIRGEVDLSSVGRGLSKYPYMLVLEQSKNERLLYDYVLAHGKDVRWQTELVELAQDETRVTAKVKTADGEVQTIEAQYLVGCDGAKSPVRHLLDLKFEGNTIERMFYVADARVDWKFPHDALHVFLAKHSVVAFFPMQGDNRCRIVGAFPEEFAKNEGDVLYEEIERRIKEEATIELDISEVRWFSTYRVHTRHVENFRRGRCFLAGDSAHVHTPAGGQGMNTGIQDAYNLAWKLAFVLHDKADEKILESYNTERLENAENLLKTTDRMFNFLAGEDWLMNLVRLHLFPRLAGSALSIEAVRKEFFRRLSQIGINYRRHALSRHAGDEDFAVKAGDRLPYFLMDGMSVFDALRAPKFHLLVFTAGESDYAGIKTGAENEFAETLDFHNIALYPQVAEIFDSEKPFMVLLRPDNHVAFITSEISLDKARSYFREIIGRH
ncbi:MAG TPA: FAD-dependent monooxygenase [Pyrinomonadaceae bacterium]|jgi:2-polyprenyl-6-methoxyphenol hydroxylase-like FAD-dependent oxidoreductase